MRVSLWAILSGWFVTLGAWTGALAFAQPPAEEAAASDSESVAPFEAGDHVFVEIATDRDRFVVGQPITIRVRVGYDPAFLRDHAIQLFRRELDVPLQVLVREIEEMPGVTPLDANAVADRDRKTVSIAVDDGVARAERADDVTRDGRAWHVVEIERRFRADETGVIDIPAPRLRFAYATRFEDSFIGGRTPVDRCDAAVAGEARSITVEGLPESERPAAFTGGIGSFTMTASADPRSVTAGETIRLELRIEGEGNLADLEAPRLDDLDGFHVYGHVERDAENARVFAYDVSPLRGSVAAVPPIALAFFDPSTGAYRTIATEAVPLDVAPGPDESSEDVAANDPETPGGDGDRVDSTADSEDDVVIGHAVTFDFEFVPSSSFVWVFVILPAVLLLAFFVAKRLARRGRRSRTAEAEAGASRNGRPGTGAAPPSAAAIAAARGAAGAFRNDVSGKGADPVIAMVAYLGARLHCAPAAVIDPALDRRLVSAGIEPDLATRTAAWVEAGIAARYGGPATGIDPASAESLVGELEARFSRMRS